uniref:Uncharacterized protein n=1 Tax=Medicago truncatula TaxID=3880 RepID=B7FGU5_MEDTR|nr:unknown [Medicago truncatula]
MSLKTPTAHPQNTMLTSSANYRTCVITTTIADKNRPSICLLLVFLRSSYRSRILNGANFLLDLGMHFTKSSGFFFHFLQAAPHLVELLHTTGFIVGGGHVDVSFHLSHAWDFTSVNLMLFLIHLSFRFHATKFYCDVN